MPETTVEAHCKAEKCKREVRAKGYCPRHFKEWRRGELPRPRYKTCKEENCRKPLYQKGYCEPHYGAWSKSRKARAHTEAKAQKAKATPAAAEAAPQPAETAEQKPTENQPAQS